VSAGEAEALLTEKDADRAARLACQAVGLDGIDVELIRLGHNALYRLPTTPAVVRVARRRDDWPRAEREVCLAAWLADVGVPAVRLWGSHRQPIEALERPVTFWEELSSPDGASSARDLGGLLAALHNVPTSPPCDLPGFDPLTVAEVRARNATNLPNALTAVVLEQSARLRAAYRSLDFALPAGVIHGDAYIGNVLHRGDGAPVLIDLEGMAVGPREWDLVPMAIAHRRFGLPETEWDAFVDAYGFDIQAWPGFEVLTAMREVMVTSWLMQLVDDRPGALAEIETRIDSIREGDRARRWRPF